MVSVAERYRAAWDQRTRNRLSDLLQGYGECLRQQVLIRNDNIVVLSRTGYKNCGANIRRLMRDFMRGEIQL